MQMLDTKIVELWLWQHGDKMKGLLLSKLWDVALGRELDLIWNSFQNLVW